MMTLLDCYCQIGVCRGFFLFWFFFGLVGVCRFFVDFFGFEFIFFLENNPDPSLLFFRKKML